MNKFKALPLFKIVTIISFMMILSLNAFPIIFGNGSGGGYCDNDPLPGCPGTFSLAPGFSIETYVEEGAGYFLQANASFLALLNRVEMSNQQGVDYDELKKLAEETRQNLENAVSTYALLVELAENTPYNTEVTGKLKTFDYYGLMVKSGLNRVIFSKTARYLSTGDITGMFKHIHGEMQAIETLLAAVRGDITAGRMPELPLLWDTHKTFSDTSMFGQFAARVLYAL